jgi:hypothetical protein
MFSIALKQARRKKTRVAVPISSNCVRKSFSHNGRGGFKQKGHIIKM